MSEVRYIILSDLHLGADNSILTCIRAGSADFTQASPALRGLAACIRALLAAIPTKPTLILNGDLLELGLCTAPHAAMVLRLLVDELVRPGEEWPFQPQVVFLPGNHDHHLWELTRETAYLEHLVGTERGAELPPVPHVTRLLADPGADSFVDPFLTELLRGHPQAGHCSVVSRYPNVVLLSDEGGRGVLIHHGHFVEPVYTLVTELRRAIFPDSALPADVEELEAENFAWIDFVWSTLGRSGPAGRDVELVYERLQDRAAAKRLLRTFVSDLVASQRLPAEKRHIESLVLAGAVDLVAGRIARAEPRDTSSLLSASARAGLHRYVEGPLRNQVVAELGGRLPPQLGLIIGHTHKPFEAMMVRFAGFQDALPAYNSGGFVVDTLAPDPLHGASIMVLDDALRIAAIRLYNEVVAGSPAPVQVMGPAWGGAGAENPLTAWLREVVDPAAGPWSEFRRIAAEEVGARRELLRRRVAGRRAAPRDRGGARRASRPVQPSPRPRRPRPRAPAPRLSTPLDRIASHYQAVVVGSGYGGGIVASRLARAGVQVCLLERGRELQPGAYPDTLETAAESIQISARGGHFGGRSALYEFHVGPDISVFKGCGLGGTSLVNANVALRPEGRVWADERWPAALRADVEGLLRQSFERAEEMLRPRPYPDDFPTLPKLQALDASARALGERFYRPPITVSFQDGVNHVGVPQRACTCCGDCVTGCNYAAKNTLIMNYLPDAVRHGAEIYTEIDVGWIERRGGKWVVWYQPLGAGRERFDGPPLFVTAEIVVLAGGALGSTEVLLRSKAKGLPLSDRLGHRFTGNGDVLAFAYNTDRAIHGVGWGKRPPGQLPPVGPTITGIIDARWKSELTDGMVIEEGAMPGALAAILPEMFAACAALERRDAAAAAAVAADAPAQRGSAAAGRPAPEHEGAMARTQTFLVMSHDDDSGVLRLGEGERLEISWPGAGGQAVFRRVDDALGRAAAALGGRYLRDPIWSPRFGEKLITVHPLGGCVMAERAEDSVVDHKGRVFSGPRGSPVHEGLYVCDGAIIPTALGVNPLLTISALAERCAALMARDYGWRIDYSLPVAASPNGRVRVGIEFTERMAGTWVPERAGVGPGSARPQPSPVQFALTIAADDLEALLTDPEHRALLTGTVSAAALSSAPLVVNRGEFQLFVPDAADPQVLHMRYRMPLQSVDGQGYHFEGIKTMRPGSPLRLWSETTTLDLTLSEGDAPGGTVLGRGVLHIRPLDFILQLTTVKVLNAADPVQRVRARYRFGRFFAGSLFDTYVAPMLRRDG
ncbi:MAG: GMC family oxidoreductase N-terminal domain-containing protein [Gemmatimonadetes bacterium]|nr:GMC family oxidoreductase N-terminal domain-containing protein [Gemmatimonadota bacterium]